MHHPSWLPPSVSLTFFPVVAWIGPAIFFYSLFHGLESEKKGETRTAERKREDRLTQNLFYHLNSQQTDFVFFTAFLPSISLNSPPSNTEAKDSKDKRKRPTKASTRL